MANAPYSDDELTRYFNDPEARQPKPSGEGASGNGASGDGATGGSDGPPPDDAVRGALHRRLGNPKLAQAAFALSLLVGLALVGALTAGFIFWTVTDDIPATESIENPRDRLGLATIAYTADGQELARYARQNRSWAPYDSISPHVIHALIATEDQRFHRHWGVDLQGIFAAVADIAIGDFRGASTITQQLARNLYNEEVGREVTITRKVKEMLTAVELERRYTKREIIEMYLNTVTFGSNAFGIEAAARTFYGVDANELDELQAATLIGLLKATTFYNPIRNPENARKRRNVVLGLMAEQDYVSEAFVAEHRDEPVGAEYRSVALHASLAPYFAEHVRGWLNDWSERTGRDFYSEGLRVYTTLDTELQTLANAAVAEQMTGLQAVVDVEWSQPSRSLLAKTLGPYLERQSEVEAFKYFWETEDKVVNDFIRRTERYRRMRARDRAPETIIAQLRDSTAFMDSLRTASTRLEAGLVSIDPHTGHVKTWVGGRDFKEDKYDKVATAQRQPGSTFKPFVYTVAIDNGYSPYDTLLDAPFVYNDTNADTTWSPGNFGGYSDEMLTLSQGLARSNNNITGRLVLQVGAGNVAQYAERMGIKSELTPVPSLALGTSDVNLLEMTSAYATLANGGLYNEPVVVTRIEDRFGNILWEHTPTPREALSERTAYTMVDMLRGVVDYGTAIRIRGQWRLGAYDLAGKTGTTQESADGWFMLMHPNLVNGAWVGFNDRRLTFRTNWWGQGAHNALFLVGDYLRRVADSETIDLLDREATFPMPSSVPDPSTSIAEEESADDDGGKVGW
jgi:penicillin-binding protein 1A